MSVNLGFSYIGFLFLLMLMIPNLIWTKYQPVGYDSANENKILLLFERAGQVLTTCCALIFTDLNLRKWSVLLAIYGKVIWLMIAVIILGIGHIGIHIQHSREIKSNSKQQ